ncbi:hypothetical protein ACM66B_004309 [Microbotryomycetes sp. NB124-2]
MASHTPGQPTSQSHESQSVAVDVGLATVGRDGSQTAENGPQRTQSGEHGRQAVIGRKRSRDEMMQHQQYRSAVDDSSARPSAATIKPFGVSSKAQTPLDTDTDTARQQPSTHSGQGLSVVLTPPPWPHDTPPPHSQPVSNEQPQQRSRGAEHLTPPSSTTPSPVPTSSSSANTFVKHVSLPPEHEDIKQHLTAATELASSTHSGGGGSERGGLAAAPRATAAANTTTTSSGNTPPSTGTLGLSSWKRYTSRTSKLEHGNMFKDELPRDYDFWASAGLTLCNIGGFPGTALAVLTAFDYGGPSMYSIAWPISGLFMLCLAAVLGEMASTYPVAGAMFTWTFRLCRSSKRLDPWARFMSWVVGTFLLVSHILLQILITWQFGHNLLGTIGLYTHVRYSPWVTVAICWAILVLSALVVSSPIARTPWLWRFAGGTIITGFIILNATMLSQADQIRPASYVFGAYRNNTGYSSRSMVYILGWVLTCVASGMESSAHVAEDTKAPARTVPLAMFWSVAATYAMGWMSICVLLATADVTGLDPTLQPSVAVLARSIPRRYATLVLVFVLLSFVFQAIAQLLATSRYTWALARESALPFSHIVRRLSRRKLPVTAIWIIVALCAPVFMLLCINTTIISTILLEGAGVTVMISYCVPCVLYLIGPRDALAGDGRVMWTLRSFSKPAAALASLFSLAFIIVLCLPTGWPVNALNASYAAGVAFFVFMAAALLWIFYGNSRYAGPIKTTTRWTIGAEVELPRSGNRAKSTTPNSPLGGNNVIGGGGAGAGHPTPAGQTTSAAHGRSAHVFSSFPTLLTNETGTGRTDESYTTSGGTFSGYSSSGYDDEETGMSATNWTIDQQQASTMGSGEGTTGRHRVSRAPAVHTP